MKEIEKFKSKLEEKFNLPIYFEQEFCRRFKQEMRKINNETIKQ